MNKPKCFHVISIVLLLNLISVSECFSRGAPFSTCLTMFPKHKGTEMMEGNAPYHVNITPEAYTPGQLVTGKCQILSNLGETRQIPLTLLSPLGNITTERDSNEQFSFVI